MDRREFISRNGKCPLCGAALAGRLCMIHEKAGRIHAECGLDGKKWKRWMEKVGLIPTEIAVEVVDDKE